ncbi:hypothetical protein COLO4_35591 [Corchorus olitorius]|uniref:Uncharacterized protein n=1 Tax=Corchorus olitorius TaxID=93759 RepID=A0A1R3GEX0_9ROSI|nr:hypothetical protein COLO4_35591 [Corchorus olitorius]
MDVPDRSFTATKTSYRIVISRRPRMSNPILGERTLPTLKVTLDPYIQKLSTSNELTIFFSSAKI